MSVATGEFVAQHVEASESQQRVAEKMGDGLIGGVPVENVQPNGVDLTVGEVYRTSGHASFRGDDYSKPRRMRLEPHYDERPGETPYYRLYQGQHIIVYDETIRIPEGYVGRVYPRSRFMRSGLHLTSALWDMGYEGQGEGLLQVPIALQSVKLEVGYPVGQLVLLESDDPAEFYNGTHQGERLEE